MYNSSAGEEYTPSQSQRQKRPRRRKQAKAKVKPTLARTKKRRLSFSSSDEDDGNEAQLSVDSSKTYQHEYIKPAIINQPKGLRLVFYTSDSRAFNSAAKHYISFAGLKPTMLDEETVHHKIASKLPEFGLEMSNTVVQTGDSPFDSPSSTTRIKR